METMKVYPSWLTSGSRKISASVKAYSWLPIIYLNRELFWQSPEFPLYIPYTQTCLPKESIDKLDQSAHSVQLKLTLFQDAKVDVSSCQADLTTNSIKRDCFEHFLINLWQILVKHEGSDFIWEVEGIHKGWDDRVNLEEKKSGQRSLFFLGYWKCLKHLVNGIAEPVPQKAGG